MKKKWLKEELVDKKEFNLLVSYLRAKNGDKFKPIGHDPRLRLFLLIFFLLTVIICGRLVILMFFQHDFYLAMAAGNHDFYDLLHPKRGEVFVQDTRTGEEFPLAMNKDYFLLYADTRAIENDETAEKTAEKLSEILQYDDEKKLTLYLQLNKRTDPYEPIENKLEQDLVDKIKELSLPGINFIRQSHRYYPEDELASSVIGFLGKDEQGNDIGRYGVEGYWQKELAGKGGFLAGAKTAGGGLVALSDWSIDKAENGADLVLTIDRTLQYKACEILRQGKEKFGAVSASLVMLNPQTGAILAMCSLPDFDPNNYGFVSSTANYNNSTIFTPYEPGSVFKPITMVAALNEELIKPTTTFVDTGERAGICHKPIKNAAGKIYGSQDMNGVLENSINTGMVFVAEKLGKKKFVEYVENFGFGVREGIELDTEVTGNISTLYEKKGDNIDCYAATASFGQGITATPLQLAMAYGAIANGGKLLKPYIVEEIRYSSGKIEKIKPQEIRQILDNRSTVLLRAMLVNVVDHGHAKLAGVKGYYIGGKTGTAQIPGLGGYSLDTNHSFVGIAPIDDPKFVMVVKFEKPQMEWAESTASPVFGEIAKFALQYYKIPPSRED